MYMLILESARINFFPLMIDFVSQGHILFLCFIIDTLQI
jgi:hypothetical protein